MHAGISSRAEGLDNFPGRGALFHLILRSMDLVCGLTGSGLFKLRRWQRHSLVTNLPDEHYRTSAELSEIREGIPATAGGAMTREISFSRVSGGPVKSFGWPVRGGDILLQLESGSERDMMRLLRLLSRCRQVLTQTSAVS